MAGRTLLSQGRARGRPGDRRGVAVTVQDANEGDTTTSRETLIDAAEKIEMVVSDGDGLEEVVGDKGYHSNQALVDLEVGGACGVTSRNPIADGAIGRSTPRLATLSIASRRRIRAERGKRLLRQRGERLERPFAHLYETGRMRRVHLRGHGNILKRVLLACLRVESRPADADAVRRRHAPEPPGLDHAP